MEICYPNNTSKSLYPDINALIKSYNMIPKVVLYLSQLDIDAKQLWILRFYHQYGILPMIKQSLELPNTYLQKNLTLKLFSYIIETKLNPQKIIFSYQDFVTFFEDGITPDKINGKTINILLNWKNNRAT